MREAMQHGQALTAVMSATIEWLAGDDCHALDEAGLAARLGHPLKAARLPLAHPRFSRRPLHPEILGHTIGWAPGEPVQVYRRDHDIVRSAAYLGHPVRRVLETQTPLLVRVEPQRDAPWTQNDVFKGRPLVELLILP